MPRFLKTIILVILVVVMTYTVAADEGMWMPHQVKELNLETQGLKMDPGELIKTDGSGLMSAIVHVGIGGTGSFVSDRGLIFTNHHVAFGAVQRASDETHDYIANGFLARDQAEEIQAPGYYIDVLLGYEDVTAVVLKKLKPDMTAEQRYKTLDLVGKKLVAAAEKQGRDLWSEFKAMYSGNKYYLFTYKRLWDVRIVYAPPRSIGNFGGEVDNWMWPRHTGDFSFLRAYVSKDNIGDPYHPDNVPYRPKSFLKISLAGIKEGDFTFSMGYPAKTQRNTTLGELQLEIKKMELKVSAYKEMIAFLEHAGDRDQATRIKYASRLKYIHNGLKNREAKLEGIRKLEIQEKKRQFEEELQQWINEQQVRQKQYNGMLLKIENFIKQNETFYLKKQQMDDFVSERLGPGLFAQAHLIYRVTEERRKPAAQRDTDFQENNIPGILTRIEVTEKGYELETDKEYFKFLLKQMLTRDKGSWPKAFTPVLEKGPDAIDEYVDRLYKATMVKDAKKRQELVNMKPAALLALKDPMLQSAADFEAEMKTLRQLDNIKEQELTDLRKLYLAALLEKYQGKLAPDANTTLRFTYGPVERYYPRDGVIYLAQTTLTGIMEKESGVFPFEVPEKLKKLYQARDFGVYMDKNLGDIATCFINTTNVTGGSSGSPVMNAEGEIVGISFDMVYESVVGDFFIIPEIQRVINADIRYALFITDKFSGASQLLKELGY